MSDPYAIFADGRDAQREALASFWPELYESLARLDQPAAARNIPCGVAIAHPVSERRKAIGRVSRNGTPACEDCFVRLRDRPVHPLELQPPKDAS